jgi:hypothetical protein
MIIYKCRFTGDEMLSDAFKPTPVLDEEGNEVPGLIQIQSQKVNKVRATRRRKKLMWFDCDECPAFIYLLHLEFFHRTLEHPLILVAVTNSAAERATLTTMRRS